MKNKSVVKDKYLMPILDNLLDIVDHVGGDTGKAFYSILDKLYARGQVKLRADTSRRCNFQIIGGKATEVCRFVTGFNGLTTMPTEFQNVMDLTSASISTTLAFIDDILIVTHRTDEEHVEKVTEVLRRLTGSSKQQLEKRKHVRGGQKRMSRAKTITLRCRINNLFSPGNFKKTESN